MDFHTNLFHASIIPAGETGGKGKAFFVNPCYTCYFSIETGILIDSNV
jgi:hypothetical protein